MYGRTLLLPRDATHCREKQASDRHPATGRALGVNAVAPHVQPVVDSLPEGLSDSERQQAVDFITEFTDVFSKSEFDIGVTHVIPHRIDMLDHKPFRQPLRCHPRMHEEFIYSQVNEMLCHGIIEPSASSWASNVVLAKNGDGSLRFCLDFRQLNDITRTHTLTSHKLLFGCTRSGVPVLHYGHKIRISVDFNGPPSLRDMDKTAFVTGKGQYRLRVRSFGLTNPPSLFQRIMDMILSWVSCLVFVDYIIVFSNSFDDPLDVLA